MLSLLVIARWESLGQDVVMNLHGLQQLRCPHCQGSLTLHVFCEETLDIPVSPLQTRAPAADPAALTRIVRDGLLVCSACRVWYPIASYVPVMLRFQLPFHAYFFRKHQQDFNDWSTLSAPKWSPEPGERSIQQTFTEEWDTVRDNELTFSYNKQELQEMHRTVWLQWDEQPPADVKRILNVGCGGQGGEAEALYEISQAEVFGIDLTPTLLHASKRCEKRPYCIWSLPRCFICRLRRNRSTWCTAKGSCIIRIPHKKHSAIALVMCVPTVRFAYGSTDWKTIWRGTVGWAGSSD